MVTNIPSRRRPRVEKGIPSESSMNSAPVELQQLLLNIFKNGFSKYFDPNLPNLIQQVKQHLYNREFTAAFRRNDLLAAYAVRWSPSRALAYTHIFANLSPLRMELLSSSKTLLEDHVGESSTEPVNSEEEKTRIVCIGAGAGAELVALGGFLKHLLDSTVNKEEQQDGSLNSKPPLKPLSITAIDIADWKEITKTLHSGLTTAPRLSPYASSKTQAANAPLLEPARLNFNFMKQDILTMPFEEMGAIFTNTSLVTLMFTLNELYATSISATTNLLLSLTMLLDPGALLLVVDSPGSYSTVNIGKPSIPNNSDEGSEKKYPMQWLLDHTLLEASAIGSSKIASGERQWEKVEGKEAEWFRLDAGLKYPIGLEDMRFQLHLYRRL